jgi:amino acid transporter
MRWPGLKARLIGRPLRTDEAEHQLLRKILALPVFSSDPLSSVAYATEEMMLVLALVGTAAYTNLIPLSMAVAALLAIVVASYRQTIRAYPQGGGSFIVANENLGLIPGTVAAAAILSDYTLTVSVSVSAGVAAITSAAPGLFPARVPIALLAVVLLTVANLRGAKEAGTLFAIPTYAFVVTVFTMLITGLIKCADGACPTAVSAGAEVDPVLPSLTLFLLLRAFASGATALTGVEAIADGVQAFREPKARNAATTLTAMGVMAIGMFLGITFLAHEFDVVISEELLHTNGTVISQIGRAVFGGGAGFYILQVVTAAILFLAANTAYQDFPRLSAILANHRLMPRQLRNRGDRLVFSNGVGVLALAASSLIILFDASVTRLIQLYVIGVFTAFTLSQAGMVRHWIKTKEKGWRRSIVINAAGSLTTGVVLVVAATVKFTHGAWIVIVAIPLLSAGMLAIRRHYRRVASRLRDIPVEAVARPNRVLVFAAHLDPATDRAVGYAEMISGGNIEVVHAAEDDSDDFLFAWERLYPRHPLTLLEGTDGSVSSRLLEHVRSLRRMDPETRITVVMCERFRSRSRLNLFVHRNILALKARLLFEPGVVVTDMTQLPSRRRTGLTPVPMRRVETIVLVSDLTRPIREAVLYAVGLGWPVRCVHIDVDDSQRQKLLDAWGPAGFDLPLELVASPYRTVTEPTVRYVRKVRRDCLPGTLVNVIIPEFIVEGRLGQLLHNQTGLSIKAVLAPERMVAVTSVPFHLAHSSPEIGVPSLDSQA